MVHLLSQLDPMVWLMMVVVAVGFAVSAVVLVELLPGSGDLPASGGSGGPPAVPPTPDGGADASRPPGDERSGSEVPPV